LSIVNRYSDCHKSVPFHNAVVGQQNFEFQTSDSADDNRYFFWFFIMVYTKIGSSPFACVAAHPDYQA
jgi:hypothetical protein